jgi:hypothetical protein
MAGRKLKRFIKSWWESVLISFILRKGSILFRLEVLGLISLVILEVVAVVYMIIEMF